MLAIHQTATRFVARPVYVACEGPPAKPKGTKPGKPATIRDAENRLLYEVAVDTWVTVAGTSFALGTAVDADEDLLLVEFDADSRIWVREKDTIRPATISRRTSRRAG